MLRAAIDRMIIDALERHPAGRDRQRGAHHLPRPPCGGGERGAGFGRIGEPAAVVGKNDRVGAEEPKQRPEHQHRVDAAAGAGRVREVDELGELFDQFDEGRNPDQHRRDEDHAYAGAARDLRALAQPTRCPGKIRRVEDGPARAFGDLVHGVLARDDAVGEGRIRLIGDAVIVLDDVDAAAREHRAQAREFCHRDALRFERGARQRAFAGAQQRPNAGNPVIRPRESSGESLRKRQADQPHVLQKRTVAEDHVHELRGLAADRLDGDLEVDPVAVRAPRFRRDAHRSGKSR